MLNVKNIFAVLCVSLLALQTLINLKFFYIDNEYFAYYFIMQRWEYCGQREHELWRPVRDTEYRQFNSHQWIFADYGHSLAEKYKFNCQRNHWRRQYYLLGHCDCGSNKY